MKDESILKNTGRNTVDNATYINDCIKEVCLNGDSLTKYKRMIEKQYGAEFYQKCSNFVKEVKRSAKRGKFTQTSLTNLQYLANEIDISPATIDELVKYHTQNASMTPYEESRPLIDINQDDTEREAEAIRLQEEEEEKKRQQKREERRQNEAERRRLKKEEEEKQRREEERKRKEEERQRQLEENRNKLIVKWLIVAMAVVIALCVFIPAFRNVVAEIIGGFLALVFLVYIIYHVFSYVASLFE